MISMGLKKDELSKADKKMLKNMKIAGEIVLLEDLELLKELGRK